MKFKAAILCLTLLTCFIIQIASTKKIWVTGLENFGNGNS